MKKLLVILAIAAILLSCSIIPMDLSKMTVSIDQEVAVLDTSSRMLFTATLADCDPEGTLLVWKVNDMTAGTGERYEFTVPDGPGTYTLSVSAVSAGYTAADAVSFIVTAEE